MIDLVATFFRNRSYPLNKITIFKKNIFKNYHYLSSLQPNLKICPVLKSNAYGHGIKEIGKIVDAFNAPFLCVDSLFEAYQLKKTGVKTPILIMGFIDPKSLKGKKMPFSFAVFNTETLEALNKYQKGANVHIFVDSGMNREGFKVEDLHRLVADWRGLTNINIVGLMSHFAQVSDSGDKQTKVFKAAIDILNQQGYFPSYVHIAASSGLLYLKNITANIARVGLCMYGLDPEEKDKNLLPALRLTTKIAQVKSVKKGEKIGYDFTFEAKKDLVIGILPIGYNDGIDRRLSNKGVVKIGNQYCPIVGLISMNITTIDITEIKEAKVGDEVVVYSQVGLDKNSIYSCAKICKTIPYELLVHLNPSTRREVV